MERLLPLTVALALLFTMAMALPPSCSSKVFCQGRLLHDVQMARLSNESKDFVDMHMIKSEAETLKDYDTLIQQNGNLTKDQLRKFVEDHFESGTELVNWVPDDIVENPSFLKNIKDPVLRRFAKDVVSIWPNLTRKVSPDVEKYPERHSIVYLPNGFAIPGGRFKEIYYWDSYWIIEGLLLSEMTHTARGMIENLLHLVKKFGHIPNGSRVYYAERSQPPLVTAMAAKYVRATNDTAWLKNNIKTLEEELMFWMNERTVKIRKDGVPHVLLRYNAESEGPRPESYYEDVVHSEHLENDPSARQEFYSNIKSAAESGWDFSSRWFVDKNGENTGNLSNVRTKDIIPVDLNSIFANALQTLGDLHATLNSRHAIQWWVLAEYWRQAIDSVLWDEKDGIWHDYDNERQIFRRYFYPSNVAPLWANAVNAFNLKKRVPRVLEYLQNSPGLHYPGGIPTSIIRSSEQWDLPNAWPPLQSIVILGLRNTQDPVGMAMARNLAEMWIRANLKGFTDYELFFEKYDAENPGQVGGGGEYVVQSGFGWTNGVILELLNIFGDNITASS